MFADLHRRPRRDPLVEPFRRIAPAQGYPNAAVRSRVAGDFGEAVDEEVSSHFHAEWQGSVVEKFRAVHALLVAGHNLPVRRGLIPFAGADSAWQDDPVSVKSTQDLASLIDLNPFRGAGRFCRILAECQEAETEK